MLSTQISEKVKAAQSYQAVGHPTDCSLPGSSAPGILQVRILEWVAIFFHQGIFLTQGSNSGFPHCRQTQVGCLGRKDPLEREWQPTPIFLPGESHGQGSLTGYSPWGHKEAATQSSTHGLISPLEPASFSGDKIAFGNENLITICKMQ